LYLYEKNTTKIDDTAVLNNPFMKKSTLQYQAPEFDKIKDEHFAPAFDYGLKVNDFRN
jgi:peptidyl-dipeptidase Dcp